MQNFGMKTWIFHPVTWNGCVALLMAQNVVHGFVTSFFWNRFHTLSPQIPEVSPPFRKMWEHISVRSKVRARIWCPSNQVYPFFERVCCSFMVGVCCVCVSRRGTWRSWLWRSMWGTCSSSMPACCLRGAFSFLPASSAPWVTFTPPTVLSLKEQNHVNLLETHCPPPFFLHPLPWNWKVSIFYFFFFLCPAYVLRARAQCCVISHVLATHLYPSTATTPAGLHLVRNIHTYLPTNRYTLLFTWLPFGVPADLLIQSPICLPSHLATYL